MAHDKAYTFVAALLRRSKNRTATNLDHYAKRSFKVDVEGWEYRLLDELVDNASLMTGLAIEFHDIDLHFDKLRDFISRFPLTLVHTHCNNFVICNDKGVPLVIECTFTAFDAGEELVSSLPSGLDMPNNARKEDYQITFYDQLSPVPS